MSREKQIEELTNFLWEQNDCLELYSKGDCRQLAIELVDAGYRKASEVAREIFEKIDKILKTQERYLYCNPSLTYIYELIEELKQNYTEVENDT